MKCAQCSLELLKTVRYRGRVTLVGSELKLVVHDSFGWAYIFWLTRARTNEIEITQPNNRFICTTLRRVHAYHGYQPSLHSLSLLLPAWACRAPPDLAAWLPVGCPSTVTFLLLLCMFACPHLRIFESNWFLKSAVTKQADSPVFFIHRRCTSQHPWANNASRQATSRVLQHRTRNRTRKITVPNTLQTEKGSGEQGSIIVGE